MNGLVKKLKRSTICTKEKRTGNKKLNLRMDVCFADDSNDSGFDIDSRLQNSNNRNVIDGFDPSSSDDLDRDSSDDSIDSGIFGESGIDELSCTDVLTRTDAGKTQQQEDNGLASLLCQSVTISEETNAKNDDTSEPPSKRLCLIPGGATGKEFDKPAAAQMKNSTQINLLGIASENERPHLQPTRTGNSNVSSLSSNQMVVNRRKINRKQPSLHITYPNRIKDGQIDLRILSQPEEQHRARYMTEGSRGAIKDRRGSAFPTVKLFGYNQPVTLQVFIGTDQGKIQPHLFYQACKVSGKNCTPCTEKVIDGTTVIEISMLPDKDMTVSCDCIGILKERNVDVEQRLPYFNMTRAKKKNTRCRMVFRVNLSLAEGTIETLQVASSPILCTQPPGVPEISKKSIKECSVSGGTELFIIGKNFLKDTKIIFEEEIVDDDNVTSTVWQEVVEPEKEYLHQTHLVCRVPPYHNQNINEQQKIHLTVQSGGKTSEPHTFIYLPLKPGLATDNLVGNYQHITSSVPGNIDFGPQMHRSQLMPTIIQVPGSMSTTAIPTILMSQTPSAVSFPEDVSHNTNPAKSDFNKTSSANSQRISRGFSKLPINQENGKNAGQIHVLVLQQNERNRRHHSLTSVHGNRLRNSCFPGKRLNRFGYKGKFMAAARNKMLQQQEQSVQNAPQIPVALSLESQSIMGEPLILKQEMICDASTGFAGNLITAEQVNRTEQEQNAAATIISQSLPQTILSTVEQASDFQPQQLSPVDSACDSVLFPTTSICEVDRIHSEIFQAQPIMQVSPIHAEVLLQSPPDTMKVVGNPVTQSQTVLQSALMTSGEMQSLVENGNLLTLQQQPAVIQQNEILSNDANLLAMQEASLKNNLLQTQLQCGQLIQEEVCSDAVADHLSPECLPAKLQQISNEELRSNIPLTDMLDNQSKVLVCIPQIKEPLQEENPPLSEPTQNFIQQPLKCEVRSDEFISHPQHGCLNSPALPVTELLRSSDLGDQLSLPTVTSDVKTELLNSISTSTTLPQPSQQTVGVAQFNHEVVQTQVDRSSLLQALQQEQILNALPTDGNASIRSSSNITLDQSSTTTAIDHLIQPMKQQTFLAQGATLQPPNSSCISLNLNALPTPPVTSSQLVIRPDQQSAAVAVTSSNPVDVKREPHCDLMSTYQHSITNALSMLSESDLLSLINPSTFDNV